MGFGYTLCIYVVICVLLADVVRCVLYKLSTIHYGANIIHVQKLFQKFSGLITFSFCEWDYIFILTHIMYYIS